MARPNFKQGKPIAVLLVAALLEAAIAEELPVGLRRLRVQLETEAGPRLRVKGTTGELWRLIQVYAQDRQWIANLISQVPNLRFKGCLDPLGTLQTQLALDLPAAKTAIANGIRCLIQRKLAEDRREDRPNQDSRHFVLGLSRSPLDISTAAQILMGMFGPEGAWDCDPVRVMTAKPVPDLNLALLKWIQLLPQNLLEYSSDRLRQVTHLIPDLETLANSGKDLAPAAQIQVLETLIRFYLAISDLDRAEELLSQVEEVLHRKDLDLSHALAQHHHQIGTLAHQKGHLSQARLHFRQAIAQSPVHWVQTDAPSPGPQALSQQQQDDHQQRSHSLHNLATVELALGNLEAAEAAILAAIALRRTLPQSALNLANSLITLAHVRSEQQRWPEAQAIYQQTQTHFYFILQHHSLLAHLHTGLGHTYAKQGKDDLARQCYTQAIDQLICLEGSASPSLVLPQAALRLLRSRG